MAVRTCSACEELMVEGYTVGNGEYYYCSDKCLHTVYTPEEWEENYNEEGDDYYTTWYDAGVDEEDISMLFNALLAGDNEEVEEVLLFHDTDDKLTLHQGIMDKLFNYIHGREE